MGHFFPLKDKKKKITNLMATLIFQPQIQKVVEIQSPDPTVRSPDVGAHLTIIFNVNKPL